MKRIPISMRRITFVLSLIVLPLTSLVCSWSPSLPQANGPTATPASTSVLPSNGGQGNVPGGAPTLPGGAGNPPSQPTAATTPVATTTPKSSEFSLQISWQGTLSLAGLYYMQYGPDTATVALNRTTANTYAGSYSGNFKGRLTGRCNAASSWPVSFEVTADEQGSGDLSVTVKTTIGKPDTVGSCEGLSGPPRVQGIIVSPQTFTLPAEDGASKTWTADPITWTYTLKKQGP